MINMEKKVSVKVTWAVEGILLPGKCTLERYISIILYFPWFAHL